MFSSMSPRSELRLTAGLYERPSLAYDKYCVRKFGALGGGRVAIGRLVYGSYRGQRRSWKVQPLEISCWVIHVVILMQI